MCWHLDKASEGVVKSQVRTPEAPRLEWEKQVRLGTGGGRGSTSGVVAPTRFL